MDKYFRYFVYFLVASTLVFAAFYIWLFLNKGDFSKVEITIVNQEPYSIRLEITAITADSENRLYRGSIEQGKIKLVEKFTYGEGIFKIKLNKKFDFSIGTFSDKNNFSKRLIIKDDKAYFESETN